MPRDSCSARGCSLALHSGGARGATGGRCCARRRPSGLQALAESPLEEVGAGVGAGRHGNVGLSRAHKDEGCAHASGIGHALDDAAAAGFSAGGNAEMHTAVGWARAAVAPVRIHRLHVDRGVGQDGNHKSAACMLTRNALGTMHWHHDVPASACAESVRATSRCRNERWSPGCCEMHVSHACHMHEPGTDARIWTCDVWWAAPICNIVWCICLSSTGR